MQIKEWNNSQEDRSFNQLVKIDNQLKQGSDQRIWILIEKQVPILTENGGVLKDSDLDNYLDDLYSIYQANERKIISIDSVYEWFSDYLYKTMANKEILNYLNLIRKEDKTYYHGLEEFAKRVSAN